ncbi:cytosolic sulfotransferase 15-like [Hibiscus syriacus]|uniref:cytosolic sulfotransferase 15-like n=1 Tax=Hibiscus syriacus TaxID=106335 RepID=UPI0019249524|nr:cytosolic sulfotransferase 15-like [Hibiscus syriacus]
MEEEQSRLGLGSSTPNPSLNVQNVRLCQGFWTPSQHVPFILSFQKHFQALDDDIIVASKPKVGITWLKALVFTIFNRHRYTLSNSPLNSANPRKSVPYFEINLFNQNPNPNLSNISSSVHNVSRFRQTFELSDCLYGLKSLRHHCLTVALFKGTLNIADWPLEDCFKLFCRGEETFGPLWDHALGY